jgi:hypothetical protein
MTVDEIEDFVRRWNSLANIRDTKKQIDLNRRRIQALDSDHGRRIPQYHVAAL